jgi:hypothetical protein
MKLPKKISIIIIALAIGIIGGASWCSGEKPLKQKIIEKVAEKAIDTAVDKAKEELQKKVIDKIFE